MNLILWARGITSYPAIGVGGSCRYYVPGGHVSKAKVRIVVPPIRRCVIWGKESLTWLKGAIEELDSEDAGYAELCELRKRWQGLGERLAAKQQVDSFYKQWYKAIDRNPRAGRAVALFKDFSNAYVLGKRLPRLPKGQAGSKRADKAAQHYMLNCL